MAQTVEKARHPLFARVYARVSPRPPTMNDPLYRGGTVTEVASIERQALGGSVRRWFDRQSAKVGAGTGLLAGVCCIGSAVAVGAGVGSLSFFTTWVDRYQVFFIAGSIALMALWLIRLGRRHGMSRRGLRRSGRILIRHALVMGGVYVITFGLAVAAMQVAETG
jgi:hypothetical protein